MRRSLEYVEHQDHDEGHILSAKLICRLLQHIVYFLFDEGDLCTVISDFTLVFDLIAKIREKSRT